MTLEPKGTTGMAEGAVTSQKRPPLENLPVFTLSLWESEKRQLPGEALSDHWWPRSSNSEL